MATTQESYGVYTTGLYIHASAFKTSDGLLYWSMPERLVYEDRDDNVFQECNGDELLVDIVIEHYKDMFPNPVVLLDIVCQFQPNPIIDPSRRLTPGQMIVLPSYTYCEDALSSSITESPEI